MAFNLMQNPDYHNVELLLVEDSPTDAKLVKRTFEKYNMANKFFWVKDGEEALDFMFARGDYEKRKVEDLPRVILLDLKLPKIGGIEVLRALREDERTSKVPVVVMTSSREEQDVIDIYALGTNSYIVKPVEFEQFMTAVKDVGYYWLFTNEPPR